MAADCGLELERHGVTFVSLWPGPVRTESVGGLGNKQSRRIAKESDSMETLDIGRNVYVNRAIVAGTLGDFGETIEFSGKCIVALYLGSDAKHVAVSHCTIMKK